MHRLAVDRVAKAFGGVRALAEVSLELGGAGITGIVGPNGAGKSTLFNVCTGVTQPDAGRVLFDGVRVDRAAPHEVAALGIGRTFQHPRLFRSLSVYENVMSGLRVRRRFGYGLPFGRALASVQGDGDAHRRCEATLEDLGLRDLGGRRPATLSYGQQRTVELARILVSDPDVILLDEPFAGLADDDIESLGAHIRRVVERGKMVVMIEHHLDVVLRLSGRVVVMAAGSVIADGPPDRVINDPRVIAAYLGEEDACSPSKG